MGIGTKNDRIELRLTSEQKSEIERAAAIAGTSITDFSVPLLVKQATEIIRHERELRISKRAWDAFNCILDAPAKPLAGLADLLQRETVFRD
jgi:uncharacterized protein (DUF1778 family)